MRLYHLTSEKWGLTAIRNKRIKIARFADLNDPFELIGVNLTDRGRRLAFRLWKSEINKMYGLLCFSKSWSNPLLWSHYGNKHNGICLGFDIPEKKFVNVTYQIDRLELEDETLTEETVMRFLSTKYNGWSYEEEVRVMTTLSERTPQDQNYYADFGDELRLSEVIVGALGDVSRKDLEEELNRASLGRSNIKLSKARLAFRSFAVVPDKRGLR